MAFIIRFRPDIWISVEGRQIAIILKSSVGMNDARRFFFVMRVEILRWSNRGIGLKNDKNAFLYNKIIDLFFDFIKYFLSRSY